ncbi:MAG TPA: DNA-binding response regulator [Paenibacillaceae bacterium]|nr:DNA-binding response regulator [Paenibacillaceae bacterium]
MTRIVVVEDDTSVCDMLNIFFEKEGYEAEFYHSGIGVVERIKHNEPDVVILDWMLPGKDGFSLLREIRSFSSVPIMMLTAKDTDTDQVMGLEGGADDYITKPFSPFPLLARIKAILRRAQVPPANEENREHVIRGDHYQILLDTHEVTLNEKNIEGLTAKEFELLTFMAKHEKHVFSREQLIERLWGFDFPGDERTVDAHIKRLRKKIHTPPYSWIHTIWGVGYKFDGDVRDED